MALPARGAGKRAGHYAAFAFAPPQDYSRSRPLQGNLAFKRGDYPEAIARYKDAYAVEPELPHYQLNLAAAYLKVNK